ncbi:MAG: AEC family transporter [Eggerthellales bacterium]|nr:AEC family transporter [Eggerthellales bacterium]
MEVFTHAAGQTAVLCALVACGFIARKKRLMNDDLDARLSSLVMTFCFPCLIVDSVLANQNIPGPEVILPLFGYSFAIYLVSSALAYGFFKIVYKGPRPSVHRIYAFTMAFGNMGFFGFPIVQALFGSDALLLAAIYNTPYSLFLFSVGLLFVANTNEASDGSSKKLDTKAFMKCFFSPVMIASYAAIVLALLHITDSGPVETAMSMLGSATVPMALLVTGSSLAKFPLKDMLNDGWAYLAAFMRLIGIPLVVFFVFGLIIPDKNLLAVVVILAATPAATAGVLMCVNNNGDLKTMTRCTFLTTALSLMTIPLMALLVM